MARRRRSPLKKALHAMALHRVLWRAFSGPEIKSALRTSTKKVTAQSRQADVQRATKKTAAKKAAAKRADPYAIALAIPAQNRQIAARQARAVQPAKKTTAVRKKDGSGRFDGSKVMNQTDLDTYRRAQAGYVDPALLPRSPRPRKR